MWNWKFWRREKAGLPAIREDWERCDPNAIPEPIKPREWSPLEVGVKIYVATDVHRARRTAESVMAVQQQLKEQFGKDFPNTTVLMSVETFQDSCRHSTPWSADPHDISGSSTRWHCYQTATQFNEAFRDLRVSDGQKANIVIMIGDRFDDNVAATVKQIEDLRAEKGTRVFAIPTTSNEAVKKKYEAVAQAGGGLSVPLLTDMRGQQQELQGLMVEITRSMVFGTSGKNADALPAPETKQIADLREHLKALNND